MFDEWQPYEDGATIGHTGVEGGIIVRDDEHPYGARITLERDGLRAPYAISSSVYGWFVHMRFIADEPTALQQYALMRDALEIIVLLLPDQEDPDVTLKLDAVEGAIAEFETRFA